jgi:putative tricarboxylic transport membrane protein
MKKGLKVFPVILILLEMLVLAACAGNDNSVMKPATDFPKKDITIVYHSKAGSGGDIFLRNMAKPLEKILGVSILIENRTGASGANAWNQVKKAKPDGYTLIGTSSTIVSAPIVSPMDVSYKDFTPIAQVFLDPQIIYVKSDAPYKTINELLDYEKKNPKKLIWARSTPSSGDTISLAKVSQAAEIDPNFVAFEGGSEVLVAIIGGHVNVAVGEYTELKGQLDAGEVKVLSVLTEERMSQMPDVPTMKEEGMDLVVLRPRGIMAPKGTPPEVIQVLTDAIEKIYDDAEFKKVYESEGLIADFAAGDDFMKIYDDMDVMLKELLK